jgi:anti-anti-sigma regulatory factor
MSPEARAAFAVEHTRHPDGSAHVAVAGVVDDRTSCDLLDGLVAGIVPGGRLIVDLTAVTTVDGTGIAAVALARHLAELHDGTLEVMSCTGDARSGRLPTR